ncbi:MAG: hypothetical protein ACRYGK_13650 [Janthinobacterium lividum]
MRGLDGTGRYNTAIRTLMDLALPAPRDTGAIDSAHFRDSSCAPPLLAVALNLRIANLMIDQGIP